MNWINSHILRIKFHKVHNSNVNLICVAGGHIFFFDFILLISWILHKYMKSTRGMLSGSWYMRWENEKRIVVLRIKAMILWSIMIIPYILCLYSIIPILAALLFLFFFEILLTGWKKIISAMNFQQQQKSCKIDVFEISVLSFLKLILKTSWFNVINLSF